MANEQSRTAESHMLDVLAMIGLLLLSAGAFWAWKPAGLIVPGALILVFVASAARRERVARVAQAKREEGQQ